MGPGETSAAPTENKRQSSPSRPKIMAVGEARLFRAAGALLEDTADVIYADISDITPVFIAVHAPDIVVSPLASRSFDCLDLAKALHDAGFLGRYRILSDDVPNPRVLMNEIYSCCPGIDAELLTLKQMKNRLVN